MTETTPPKDDNVPLDEVLAPATPGAAALPSTDDDGGVESDDADASEK